MTNKTIRLAVLIAPALAILAALFALGVGQGPHAAEAVNPVKIGLDMKVNSTDPATYTTLPKFENCVDVKTGAPQNGVFYFDVFIQDVSQLIAFQADPGWLQFTPGKMQIQNATVKEFLGTSGVSNYSRNVTDSTSDVVNPAVSDGNYHIVAFSMSAGPTGSGVLARIKAQAFIIGGGSIINVSITQSSATGLVLTADPGPTHPGDTNGDGKFDGTIINQTATIAVDQPDGDGDGISNVCDNCPNTSNPNQADTDGDGVGDACDPDIDNDGICNSGGPLPLNTPGTRPGGIVANFSTMPWLSGNPSVTNGNTYGCVPGAGAGGADNCPYTANTNQDPAACLDSDGDGILDSVDNCPNTPNPDQKDTDGDGVGDACDPDTDNDGICNTGGPLALNTLGTRPGGIVANFTTMPWLVGNPSVTNGNTYGCVPGAGTGTGGSDNCLLAANTTQADWNNDGLGDACQDTDGDGVLDSVDNCKGFANANQLDTDGDGVGNACDNCPNTSNPNQADFNNDGIGDACQDTDGDGFTDQVELFVGTSPTQRCAATTAQNDEPVDASPLDNNDDRRITGQDILAYGPVWNKIGPNPPYKKRLDVNMDNRIGGPDILKFGPYFNKPACTYP